MTLIGGTIIFFNDQYKYFFKNSVHKKNYLDYYQIKKFDNIIYNFPFTRVVDFIIMGTQKGGTTAAMLNLEKHPDISLFHDEIKFFDYHWTKGIEWYKKHFDYKKKLVGEKNPNLLYLDYTYPMVQKLNPCVKIILFLRNPIDRAYSAWYMFTTKFTDNKENKISFEKAYEDELNYRLDEIPTFNTSNKHILQRGLYHKQIQKLLKFFPIQNILILISENVIKNMNEEYNKIYSFLDLSNYNTEYTEELVGDYDKKNKDISSELYNKLIKFYKDDVSKLEKMLGLKTNWM
jgi:hypothetical protein